MCFFYIIRVRVLLFFARQLSMYSPDTLVMPEFRLPELLIAKGDDNLRKMGTEDLFNLMKLDYQIDNLGFDDEWLYAIAEGNKGKGIKSLMESIARNFSKLKDRTFSVVLIKNGALIYYYRILLHLFPMAEFIHIFRDPRAVVNSMLRFKTPYLVQEQMGRGNVVFMARTWMNYMMMADDMKKVSGIRMTEVRYEDLCFSVVDRIKDVLRFLDVPFVAQRASDENTFFNVSGKEKGIHALFDKPPDIKRTEGWKRELPIWQGVAVEAVLGHSLQAYGYEKWFLSKAKKWNKLFCVSYAYLMHYKCTLWSYYKRLFHYVNNRKLFWIQIKLFLIRKRMRVVYGQSKPGHKK